LSVQCPGNEGGSPREGIACLALYRITQGRYENTKAPARDSIAGTGHLSASLHLLYTIAPVAPKARPFSREQGVCSLFPVVFKRASGFDPNLLRCGANIRLGVEEGQIFGCSWTQMTSPGTVSLRSGHPSWGQ